MLYLFRPKTFIFYCDFTEEDSQENSQVQQELSKAFLDQCWIRKL